MPIINAVLLSKNVVIITVAELHRIYPLQFLYLDLMGLPEVLRSICTTSMLDVAVVYGFLLLFRAESMSSLCIDTLYGP